MFWLASNQKRFCQPCITNYTRKVKHLQLQSVAFCWNVGDKGNAALVFVLPFIERCFLVWGLEKICWEEQNTHGASAVFPGFYCILPKEKQWFGWQA